MELKLLNNARKKITLDDSVFACEFNEPLVHQVVVAYMAAGRAGTKAQKTRAEVSGGGAKPWKQKGTGRARAGTIRSPIFRKGGVTFAAKPRSYAQKVNKKMYQGALKAILSEMIRQERLQIVDTFTVDEPKTKVLLNKLIEMKIEGNVLILTDTLDENLYLAARNLPQVALLDAVSSAADPVSLIKADRIIASEAAIKELEELLK